MINILDLLIQDGFEPAKKANTNGGEYSSPCPECGGKDRFRIWPEKDRFWCRQCQLHGNNIEYLKKFHGMTVNKAFQHLGIDNRRLYQPMKKPKQQYNNSPWIPKKPKIIPDLWKEKATAFVEWSHENLMRNHEQLVWLQQKRGLKLDTIETAKLGWNPKDIYRSCESWGFPDRGKDILLPHGLVIPVFINGVINRVKTRAVGREPKYLPIAEGGLAPMILNSHIETEFVIIVESELDAIFLNQECGDLITCIAMGSASYRPDTYTHRKLKQSKLILQSFDTGKGEPGAKEAWSWWKNTYMQCKRWPCIQGKDPTESYLNGIDLREWVKVGLEEHFPVTAFGFFDFLNEHENKNDSYFEEKTVIEL